MKESGMRSQQYDTQLSCYNPMFLIKKQHISEKKAPRFQNHFSS